MSFYLPNDFLSTIGSQHRLFLRLASAADGRVRGFVPSGYRNPLWTTCAERVRDRIDASGRYRLDIAAMSGLSHVAVGRVEDGKRVPRLATIERIAEALGLSPSWLAYGDEALLPFRHRRPRPVVPPDAPMPAPAERQHLERWRGVAQRLSELRKRLGLTLRDVGDAAGLSAQAILLLEKGGRDPLISTVEQLAVALDVPPGWLAFGEGEPPSGEVTAVPPERRPS